MSAIVQKNRFTGREFEKEVADMAALYERDKLACFGRYGVQAVFVAKTNEWQILQSLPDFEGVDSTGRQIIFDVKVCSAASFAWAKYRAETRGVRSRQLRHMLRRSRFGARCGFLLHFNPRELKARTVASKTFWVPVEADMDYWSHVECGEVRSLDLQDCESIGREVNWVVWQGGRKLRPDFLKVI